MALHFQKFGNEKWFLIKFGNVEFIVMSVINNNYNIAVTIMFGGICLNAVLFALLERR